MIIIILILLTIMIYVKSNKNSNSKKNDSAKLEAFSFKKKDTSPYLAKTKYNRRKILNTKA